MAKGTAGKNYWALLLMILAGVVLGGFIGQLSAGVPALRWLNYGQTFGLSNPLVLDSKTECDRFAPQIRPFSFAICTI